MRVDARNGHDTRNGRLCWAILHFGPGDRSPRAFQRAVRPHSSRITGSYNAVRGYLERERFISDAFCEVAARVLGPVTAEWLKTGEGEPAKPDAAPPLPTAPPTTIKAGVLTEDDDEPAPKAGPPAPNAPVPQPAATDDPWLDIRTAVLGATREPSEVALKDLDPKYPRRGLSERNWRILFDVVSGTSAAAAATEVKLSEARVSQICEEYAALVRKVTGVTG